MNAPTHGAALRVGPGLALPTIRLPAEGDEVVTFAGGGACRFYLTVTGDSHSGYERLAQRPEEALALCCEVLAAQDLGHLVTAESGGDPSAHLEAEHRLARALFDLVSPEYVAEDVVALTIVELIA
jgi:hypothetical protein